MLKKICALILLTALMAAGLCAAAETYDVIYSADNPIPDIADRVRPAVVRREGLRIPAAHAGMRAGKQASWSCYGAGGY